MLKGGCGKCSILLSSIYQRQYPFVSSRTTGWSSSLVGLLITSYFHLPFCLSVVSFYTFLFFCFWVSMLLFSVQFPCSFSVYVIFFPSVSSYISSPFFIFFLLFQLPNCSLSIFTSCSVYVFSSFLSFYIFLYIFFLFLYLPKSSLLMFSSSLVHVFSSFLSFSIFLSYISWLPQLPKCSLSLVRVLSMYCSSLLFFR